MDAAFLTDLRERCKTLRGRVALPESLDERVLKSCNYLITQDLAEEVWVFTTPDQLRAQALNIGINLPALDRKLRFVCEEFPQIGEKTEKKLQAYFAEKKQVIAAEEMLALSRDPLYQAGILLLEGHVDCVVAGAVSTTADVIKAGLRTVGLAPKVKTISGAFIMHRCLKEDRGGEGAEVFLFADCGVVIDPTVHQIVDIASGSMATWRALLPASRPPVLAFLSFSTKGSARHPAAEKMAEATQLFKGTYPEVSADGELQFDAAYVAAIGQRKAPGSLVPGNANCFIFPNLDAGNLAYKIAQRLGGFAAYGPLLQGLAKPFSDLSRGASVDDIIVSCMINIMRSRVL